MDRPEEEQPQVVTTARESLSDDQSFRTKRYLLTMGLRTACFVLAVVTQGWIRWVFAVGAVFLPWFAVVMANAVRPRAFGAPLEPGPPGQRQIDSGQR